MAAASPTEQQARAASKGRVRCCSPAGAFPPGAPCVSRFSVAYDCWNLLHHGRAPLPPQWFYLPQAQQWSLPLSLPPGRIRSAGRPAFFAMPCATYCRHALLPSPRALPSSLAPPCSVDVRWPRARPVGVPVFRLAICSCCADGGCLFDGAAARGTAGPPRSIGPRFLPSPLEIRGLPFAPGCLARAATGSLLDWHSPKSAGGRAPTFLCGAPGPPPGGL